MSNPNAELMREPGDNGSEPPQVELSGGTPNGAAGTDQEIYHVPDTPDNNHLDSILNREEEDLRSEKEKEDVIKALEAIVSCYSFNVINARTACGQIGQVPLATDKEHLIYIRRIIGETEDPGIYGYPFAKNDVSEPGHPEATPSPQENHHSHIANAKRAELENWFNSKIAECERNPLRYFHSQRIFGDVHMCLRQQKIC